MVSLQQQLDRGVLVCPKSRTPLKWHGNVLVSEAGTAYAVTSQGVPVLLTDAAKAEQYARGSVQMTREYTDGAVQKKRSVAGRLKTFLNKDYRTKASRDAFDTVITSAPPDSLCLSIGGGPLRPDPKLVNLNIGPFPNVDIVGDAHQLPYQCESVDAIYCEAVLEHLGTPPRAVEEMFRVLKPGGKVIAITPFMQAFHGYPNHFQNFTVVGHSLIFTNAGFCVRESGTCVGPMFTFVDIGYVFIREYFPKLLSLPFRAVWKLLGACLVPLDLLLAHSKSSHVMASTTYVLAEKLG